MSKESRLLSQIDRKMSQVLELVSSSQSGLNGRSSLAAEDLLSMPEHLRKAVMTMKRLGRATGETVSKRTKRTRAQERAILNQLVTMGILRKERIGKHVYFYIQRRKR